MARKHLPGVYFRVTSGSYQIPGSSGYTLEITGVYSLHQLVVKGEITNMKRHAEVDMTTAYMYCELLRNHMVSAQWVYWIYWDHGGSPDLMKAVINPDNELVGVMCGLPRFDAVTGKAKREINGTEGILIPDREILIPEVVVRKIIGHKDFKVEKTPLLAEDFKGKEIKLQQYLKSEGLE